jgi:hypothetical protein
MAKLPTLAEQTVEVARPSRPIVSYRPQDMGDGFAEIGQRIQRFADERTEKQSKLEETFATADMLKGQADLLQKLNEEQDYTKIPTLYQEEMAKVRTRSASMINNPAARSSFEAQSMLHTQQGLNHINEIATRKRKDVGQASTMERFDTLIEAASNTTDPKLGTAMLKNANAMVDQAVANNFFDHKQGYDLKKTGAQKYGETWLDAKTDAEKVKLLKPGDAKSGGFDNAISTVLQNEGGHVPIDGSSGAPAIFGINAKWHKGAYEEAKRISDTKGTAAGQKYATEFYKKEYWDRYGVESLPPETQTIVMDGAVNHTSTFTQKLVDAAKSGETPEALIEMRKAEYQRLARENPEKYGKSLQGWTNRLDSISSGQVFPKTGTPVDFIPVDKRVAMYNKISEADRKLRIEDPAGWGIKNGLGTAEIVRLQPNPVTASVLGKEQSKQIADGIKSANSLDTLIDTAGQIKEAYGEYGNNAILDLKRAGLGDEHESALVLATKNPALYNNQIKLLYSVAQADKTALDENLKTRGLDPKAVRLAVEEKFADDDLMDIYSREIGDASAQDFMSRRVNVTSSLAKAYLTQNPNAGIDDAVEFALQPDTDSYSIADLNGVKYRLPKDYMASDMEDRIKVKYEELARDLEKTEGSNFSLIKGAVIPVLNDKEDGIYFIDPLGDPIRANGNVAQYSFKDLLNVKTRKERINEFEKQSEGMSYQEREIFREQTFGTDIKAKRQIEENKALSEKMKRKPGK